MSLQKQQGFISKPHCVAWLGTALAWCCWPGCGMGRTGIATHSVFKSSKHKPTPFSATPPPRRSTSELPESLGFDANTLILSTGGGYRWPQIHLEQGGCIDKSSYGISHSVVYRRTEPFGDLASSRARQATQTPPLPALYEEHEEPATWIFSDLVMHS